MPIYALRTTFGQEKSVAKMIKTKVDQGGYPIQAIVVADSLRGYVFVEAESELIIEKVVAKIRHVKKRVVRGESIPLDELKNILVPKPAVEGLGEGDLVEIIDGPFKNTRARILRIDESREEVTVEFLEGMAIPLKLHAEYVRRLEKAKEKNIFDI